ncbi:MAG TPA: hypothetical protein VE869_14715 [Gemmatimonas sp.]|nr:hypothetical protein [Gemmatimonas sp.]
MTGAVAPETIATAPQERGWRWFVVALVLMVVVTAAPGWPSALALVAGAVRLLLPIEQFALLVVVAIAASSVVGWWAGGRALPALAWLIGAGWVVWKMPLPADGYGALVRGWSVSLAAAFGIVCLVTRSRPLLGRALAAVAIAGGITLLALTGGPSSGGTFDGARRMMSAEYARRTNESAASWQRRTESDVWQRFSRGMPDAAGRAERMAGSLGDVGEGGTPRSLLLLSPALLGLESLLALALGWAAYHRLSRVRIGPPLGALRELRFNDQLVWGLVVGTTVLLLPTLADWRGLGANMVCFFGTLYALRGAGVLTWWIPDRLAVVALLALVILVPLLGPIILLGVLLAVTFALGLGDTWRDFRAGLPRRPTSLP